MSFASDLMGLYDSERGYAHDGFTQLMGGASETDVAAAQAAAAAAEAGASAAASGAAADEAQYAAVVETVKTGALGAVVLGAVLVFGLVLSRR